jgi:pimeloyl-ACP methyl ester carboxylesterase
MRGEFVEVQGVRLYYFAAGTRGAGEPIVLIHGFPGSSHLWRDVVPFLPAGHRIVVLDLLGFGRSDRPLPSGPAADLSADGHADRLLAFLDDLRIDQGCVVGHGMGGAVAQSLAIRHPARVSRLALLDSTAFDLWPRGAAALARGVAATPLARLLGAGLLAGLASPSLLDGFTNREDGRRTLDQFLRAFTTRLGVAPLVAQLRAMHDPAVAALGARLGELRIPTSILWGELDPWLPVRLGERLRDAIPGATLEVIAGARHFTPEDAPERIARAVEALLQR